VRLYTHIEYSALRSIKHILVVQCLLSNVIFEFFHNIGVHSLYIKVTTENFPLKKKKSTLRQNWKKIWHLGTNCILPGAKSSNSVKQWVEVTFQNVLLPTFTILEHFLNFM